MLKGLLERYNIDKFSKMYLLIYSIVSILLIVAVLHYMEVVVIPFKPFSTTGSIYVDSPEIYTRERLLNDRYDQDYWLKEQLRNLDQSKNILTAVMNENFSVGDSGESKSNATKHSTDREDKRSLQKELALLPFDQEFRIRVAIRDNIRQRLLENMLDDRHDLTGNTVYGLKFDTTVLPGSNTHKRAFVRIEIDPPKLFSQHTSNNQLNPSLATHLELYFWQDPEKALSTNSPLHTPYRLYADWLTSIQERLNTYVEGRKYASTKNMHLCKDTSKDNTSISKVLIDAIDLVLSLKIDEGQFMNQSSGTELTPSNITLPDPWSKFMKLNYGVTEREGCSRNRLFFKVEKQIDIIYIFDDEAEIPDNYIPYFNTKNHTLAFASPNISKTNTENPIPDPDFNKNFKNLTPKYDDINDDLIEFSKDHKTLNKLGNNEGVEYLTVPSGLFNFIENIEKTDAYSYAIFPKNEVIGILADRSVDLTLAGGAKGESSWLNFVKGLRKSQVESVLIGFGDGFRLNRDETKIQFGWVIDNRGNMQPTQKTELALISVPAWTNELKIRVKTGWLDRNSSEEVTREFPLRVPVPPDYEAFDSLLSDGPVQRRPKIMDELMEPELSLVACEEAKILIPGSRLWRSATVTLGAQKARRITVLPNMEGIIAEFKPVEIPSKNPEDKNTGKDNATVNVKLRVWTSEGVDTAQEDVQIIVPLSLFERNRLSCTSRPTTSK